MASNVAPRVAQRLQRSSRIVEGPKTGQSPFVCSRCLRQRAFSTTRITRQELDIDRGDRPRWQQTPRAMAMPVRTRLQARPRPTEEEIEGISDPTEIARRKEKRLNDAYSKILGQGGDTMLPKEVKWIAITHKSYDHGRQGSNDRLAFLGESLLSRSGQSQRLTLHQGRG